MFVLIVVEAALAGAAVIFFIGMKFKWKAVVTMSATVRAGALNAWWVVPLGLVVIIALGFAFRDVCRLLFPMLRVSRASATLAGGAIAGCHLEFFILPSACSAALPQGGLRVLREDE